MRPFALDPLFRPLTTLAGIGPRFGKLFEKLVGGPKILDLLWHRPIEVVDRRFSPKVAQATIGKVVSLRLQVHLHQPPTRPSQPFRVLCGDETGMVTLVFFHAKAEWLQKQFPKDGQVVVSGLMDSYDGRPQMTHPEAVGKPSDFDSIAVVEPLYPLTAGITNRQVVKALKAALAVLPDLPEWNDAPWLARNGWTGWKQAVQTLHMTQDDPGQDSGHDTGHMAHDPCPVSYTHLTLPTNREV